MLQDVDFSIPYGESGTLKESFCLGVVIRTNFAVLAPRG